jgi:predicted aspartyl protease
MRSAFIRFAAVICTVSLVSCHLGFAKELHSAVSSAVGIVLVSATVEGQPATFLLDTGAERSCLDAVFASRLRFRLTTVASIRQPYATVPADDIRISDLEIHTFHLRDFDMLSSDLASLSQGIGVPIDGVLGSDVLRHFTVKIDFSSGSAQFWTDATIPPGGIAVKLQPIHGLYFVSIIVQGAPVSLLLDTGTNASIVSSHAWSEITMHWHPQSMVAGVRSTGGSEGTTFALIPTINIGNATSRNVPFRVQPTTSGGLFRDAGFNGLLGSDVLRRYIVTLDLANDRMYLTSNPNNHLDPNLFSTIGIQFARDEEGSFTIMAIWAPSPAQTAGLKIEDRILAVNQLDPHLMSLDELSRQIHGRPGTKVRLIIDSDGHRRDVTMATSCLLCPAKSPLETAK